MTFTNVPVKHGTDQDLNHEASWDGISTNFSFIPELVEKNVQGVRLRIPPPLIVPESTPGREYLRVNIFAEPMPESAMKLKLLQATDDKGNEIPTPPLSKWAGYHFAVFSDPPDIKTLNLKFALHRSRYVTFTVKPNRQ